MAPHQLACMYKLRDRINQLDSIPTRYCSLLEHRLVIACSEFKRQDKGAEVRSTREIRTRHAEKRAHKLYLDVLDEDPQIFIPFLLIVNTNTACVKYNLELFRQHHDQRVKIRLHVGDADKVILEDIARRHGIGGSIAFQKLIHALFPATPRTATAVDDSPTTTADGPEDPAVPTETLRQRWTSLTQDKDFFNNVDWRPIDFISSVGYERKICFLGCESLAFQNPSGKAIWTTKGDGEMIVPANVDVYLIRGKWKCAAAMLPLSSLLN